MGDVRLDLGGGGKPRPGFLNVDAAPGPGVDVVCDFERLHPDGPGRLPFADDSVAEVYSSHALEHVWPCKGLLWEIARVCRVGAPVEIRVPHWLQQMALCGGHKHTISPEAVDHWTRHFVPFWWAGSPKRLRLDGREYVPGAAFGEARGLLPGWTDEQVMRLIPDACHEVVFRLEVVPNEHAG